MHVITDLVVGGTQHVLLRLVAALRMFRHRVVLLVDVGKLPAALRSAGAEVFALRMSLSLPSLGAIARLARRTRRDHPAVLQTWLYSADLVSPAAAGLAQWGG